MQNKKMLKDMEPGEEILIVVRRHWFVFLRDVIGILILFFLPFFAIPVLEIFIVAGGVQIPESFGLFFASFWALVLWQVLFARWTTDYYYDVWIVTNWRIIDIDQRGFFHRNIATLFNFEQVQDITTDINTVIGSLLNFGNVQVQTAAAKREFLFTEVGNPRRVERIIRQAQEKRLALGPQSN